LKIQDKKRKKNEKGRRHGARPLRINFENAVYHIITRGNRKEKIFYSDEDKLIFQIEREGVRSSHLTYRPENKKRKAYFE
jgi:hypothetical protein